MPRSPASTRPTSATRSRRPLARPPRGCERWRRPAFASPSSRPYRPPPTKRGGWEDNPIEAAVRFIQILAWILSIAIFIRVIISWVGLDPRNPVVVFLHDITEPILSPLRQFLPRLGMLDLSPLLALILLNPIAHAATRLLI